MARLTPDILERYYNGTCTAEERQIVEAWLDRSEADAPASSGFNRHALWQKIEKETAGHSTGSSHYHTPGIKRYGGQLLVAASVLAILLFFTYYLLSHQKEKGNLAMADTITWDTITTGKGFRSRLVLPDSTEVILNASSVLRYPKQFADSVRVIYLDGEALLNVHKDAAHPFIVKTANGSIRVLGTRFDVDAYAANSFMAVTVGEGKVQFSAGEKRESMILGKGQRASFHYRKGMMFTQPYSANWFSWTGNKGFDFSNESLEEIGQMLAKKFGKKVWVSKELSGRYYMGRFTDESEAYIVKQIAFVLNCNYSINEVEIRFY